ncbi:MAG: Alpha-1,3-mannosyltransferase-like protein [Bogoriella megaspora]|nr:MAG: Alpha-1,3-mannosyltransferase-like protein [Bogoriella megaspora]
MAQEQRRIVFLHPDLGIGGAERLVIDAAVGLQNRGFKVTIFTSHCDPKHCFDEARDGTLDIRVRGATLFPAHIIGLFSILLATLRQLHLVLQITLVTSELSSLDPCFFFIDQLSACIPLLRILTPGESRILFYCHFPDKLLVRFNDDAKIGWKNRVKKAYRVLFDWVEEWSTGVADGVVVNSWFTRGVFGRVFPRLRERVRPGVVYPCVDTEGKTGEDGEEEEVWKDKKVVLSVNRFERKKDVGLAVKAYAGLGEGERRGTRLVVAGGYDRRVAENVAYHRELDTLAKSLGLRTATAQNVVSLHSIPDDIDVLFLLSVPGHLKATLLSSARLLVYTPQNEHFGIVPLEAMLAGTPVLAANSGGPKETVVDGETGWLRDVDKVSQWTDVMRQVLHGIDDVKLKVMGEAGVQRVKDGFSKQSMAISLEEELEKLRNVERPPILTQGLILVLATGGGGMAVLFWLLLRWLQ